MLDEVSDFKKQLGFNGACVAFLGLIFASNSATLIFLIFDRLNDQEVPSVSQEANPQITTNLAIPDPLEELEEVAGDQGFYTRKQFARKYGVTERVVDLWRDAGMVSWKTEAGRVCIPLDAVKPQ